MAVADAKERVQSFYDQAISAGGEGVIDDYLAPGYVDHDPLPGFSNDIQGTKDSVKMLLSAFPDGKMRTNLLIQDDDLVVAHTTFIGTHKGEFLGIPPTGKKVEVNNIDIVRVTDDGKATEHWGIIDTAALMQQLGIAPPTGG
jgi:predicted ester cyclase